VSGVERSYLSCAPGNVARGCRKEYTTLPALVARVSSSARGVGSISNAAFSPIHCGVGRWVIGRTHRTINRHGGQAVSKTEAGREGSSGHLIHGGDTTEWMRVADQSSMNKRWQQAMGQQANAQSMW